MQQAWPDRVVLRAVVHELHPLLVLEQELLQAGGAVAVELVAALARDATEILELLVHALPCGTDAARWRPLDEVLDLFRTVHPWLRVDGQVASGPVLVPGAVLSLSVGNLLRNAEDHGTVRPHLRLVRCGREQVALCLRQDGPVPVGVVEALSSHEPPSGRQGLGLWLARTALQRVGGALLLIGGGGAWEVRAHVPFLVSGARCQHGDDATERESRNGGQQGDADEGAAVDRQHG